jgi:hypothetical protein
MGTLAAGLGGWFSKQGVDAWLKLRADKREDNKLEDAREDVLHDKEDATLRYIIGIQQGELTSLRSEIKEMQFAHREELRSIHTAHNECEKRHAELATELRLRMELMNVRVDGVETAVGNKADAVVQELVKTRHDLKDDLNAVSMRVQEAIKAHDSTVAMLAPPKAP